MLVRLRRKARRVMSDDKARKTVPPRRSFVEFGMRSFLECWSASACDVGGSWPVVPAIVDTSGGGSGGDDDDGPGIYDAKQTDDIYFRSRRFPHHHRRVLLEIEVVGFM